MSGVRLSSSVVFTIRLMNSTQLPREIGKRCKCAISCHKKKGKIHAFKGRAVGARSEDAYHMFRRELEICINDQ